MYVAQGEHSEQMSLPRFPEEEGSAYPEEPVPYPEEPNLGS